MLYLGVFCIFFSSFALDPFSVKWNHKQLNEYHCWICNLPTPWFWDVRISLPSPLNGRVHSTFYWFICMTNSMRWNSNDISNKEKYNSTKDTLNMISSFEMEWPIFFFVFSAVFFSLRVFLSFRLVSFHSFVLLFLHSFKSTDQHIFHRISQ